MYNIPVRHLGSKGLTEMKHGFIKVAAATPRISVAACEKNADAIIGEIEKAKESDVKLLVFPELSITSATCADLFFSDALLSAAKDEALRIAAATEGSDMIIIIGFPLVVNDNLYNCAAFCQNGQILGIAPKSALSYEQSRYFSAYNGTPISIKLGYDYVPFGNGLVFACDDIPALKVGIEVGDECFARIAPSSMLCENGATVIANPFSHTEEIGFEEYEAVMLSSLSSRNVCGYIHTGSAVGESTTDAVYSTRSMILENGKIIASTSDELLISELDLGVISADRRRSAAFKTKSPDTLQNIFFNMELTDTALTRRIAPSPFIPENEAEIKARCEKILTIQASGLATRMTRAFSKTLVIGISGGLDSCLAILVAAKAMDMLGMDRKNIIGVTMPCFGTTARTKSNAELLCTALGVTLKCVNIGESVKQHFSDIGHDESNRNVVYENAQARERTQVIMDIANMENGLVVGTGDLSELVLGWATYNGDHMSMYGVNADVPKTLIRHIVAYSADVAEVDGNAALASVLRDILSTPVSPELLPADADGNIAQRTEDLVGPYEIHDFYIYYMLRYGFSPDKLYRMARVALGDKYDDETLLKWLKNLVRRFFAQQFKRSCLPDGPKVGTVGVSPRGALSMPSDASCAEWLKIVDSL